MNWRTEWKYNEPHDAHVKTWLFHRTPPSLIGRWPYNYTADTAGGAITGRLPPRKIEIREWPHHDAHVMTWRMWKTVQRGLECPGQNEPLESTGEALNLILRLEKLAEWHEWMIERAPVLNMWPNELKVHQQASKDLRQAICEMREIFT